LDIHATYTLDEALIAIGYDTAKRRSSIRQGVAHVPALKIDVFFATLNKTESSYSPTTMYEDYALGESCFHWQSQNSTSANTPTGNRYINHVKLGYTPLLFIRENERVNGMTSPYSFLGPLKYLSHTGEKPMSIIWELEYPISARILEFACRMIAA